MTENITYINYSVHQGWANYGPQAIYRPLGFFSPACQILVQSCPNYELVNFLQYPAFKLIPLDGALQTQLTFAGVWFILSTSPLSQH